MTDELKRTVLETLRQYPIGVVATVNEQKLPEAAIVGLAANDDLQVLFGTSNLTRKYRNLQENPHVAITVGDFEAEVQYEGTAQAISLDDAKENFPRVPGGERYLSDPTQTWWQVTPTWMRLTVHAQPERVEEMRLA